jgi:hypothetical protein
MSQKDTSFKTIEIYVKGGYTHFIIGKKHISHLTSPVLYRYTKLKKFNRENGTITLEAEMHYTDGTTELIDDWINLKSELMPAFRNYDEIVSNLEHIVIK